MHGHNDADVVKRHYKHRQPFQSQTIESRLPRTHSAIAALYRWSCVCVCVCVCACTGHLPNTADWPGLLAAGLVDGKHPLPRGLGRINHRTSRRPRCYKATRNRASTATVRRPRRLHRPPLPPPPPPPPPSLHLHRTAKPGMEITVCIFRDSFHDI